jgi:hypothetical protein
LAATVEDAEEHKEVGNKQTQTQLGEGNAGAGAAVVGNSEAGAGGDGEDWTPPKGLEDIRDQVYWVLHKSLMKQYREGDIGEAFQEAERLLLVRPEPCPVQSCQYEDHAMIRPQAEHRWV